MASPIGIRLAVCTWVASIMFAVTPSAIAATGRIVFSGAVVEATCSAPGLGFVKHAAAGPAVQRSICDRTATDAGRIYSREVLDLTTANRHHDRLLDYLTSYVPIAAGGDAVKVVVYTYD